MNVAIGSEIQVANRVWYDSQAGLLQVEMHGVVSGLKFAEIPDDDFESTAPVVGFSVGSEGTVVVCQHRDGAETWLPVDMWLPGGFQPAARRKGQRRKPKEHNANTSPLAR